jgi:hypothetical protein
MNKTEKDFLPEAGYLPSPESSEHVAVEQVEAVSVGGAAYVRSASPEPLQPNVEMLTRAIEEQLDTSEPKEGAVTLSYEMNGVPVDVEMLHGEVVRLSSHERELLRTVTVKAMELNALANDPTVALEARKQARFATLGTAFFSVGSEPTLEMQQDALVQPDELSHTQRPSPQTDRALGFTDWVARKGKIGFATLAAVIGLGATAPVFAGGNEEQYREAAANTMVGVLAGVLGTRAETPYRVKREVGPIQDRAAYGLERASIERQSREREITLRERAQIRSAQERYERTQDAFDVKLEMYQLAHKHALSEEFIATKEGRGLYERMRAAELALNRQTERISRSSDDARERLDGRYQEAQQRIKSEASREVQGVHRDAQGRNDQVIGSGVGDINRAIIHGIFGR